MASFITVIATDATNIPGVWHTSPDTAFSNLPIIDKCVFLMHQCVFLNYVDLVYNTEPMYLINQYKNKVIRWVTQLDNSISNKDDFKSTVTTTVSACRMLLNVSPNTNAGIDFIKSVLTTETKSDAVPRAVCESFYRPYLDFLYSTYVSDGIYREYTSEFVDVVLPTIVYRAQCAAVEVRYECKFNKYAITDALGAFETATGRKPFSFYGFLTCLDWSGQSMTTVLGFLAAQTLEFNSNYLSTGSQSWLYYKLYKHLFNWTPHVMEALRCSASIGSEPNVSDTLVRFLMVLRDTQNVTLDDAQLIALLSIPENASDDCEKLKAFLCARRSSDISVESHTAFKHSIFSKYSELNMLKVLVSKEADESTSPDTDNDTTEESSPESTPEESTSETTNDPGIMPDSTETSGDDMGGGFGDDFGNESTSDTFGGGDGSAGGADSLPTPDADQLPNTSDSTGIKLELNPGDTLDTYFWRCEADAFIKGILDNPPKNINSVKITFLRKVRVYWLWLLSVEAIASLINSAVKLPTILKV